MTLHGRWAQQLVTIYNRGREARQAGEQWAANPYKGGYRNQNGPGGNLQQQRRQAWYDGWDRVNVEITLADPTGLRLPGAPETRQA